MGKLLSILVLGGTLAAGAANADDDCYVPMTKWLPRAAVADMAAENGWTVRRIKIDDGCYEIIGRDAEGRSIEVKVHPATLAIVEFEIEHDDDHDKARKNKRKPDRQDD
ncbi:MAG: PepSY domain-containing protein [Paracoccaceae bacterium]